MTLGLIDAVVSELVLYTYEHLSRGPHLAGLRWRQAQTSSLGIRAGEASSPKLVS